MRIAKRLFTRGHSCLGILAVLIVWWLTAPTTVQAQTAGNKAVITTGGACCTSSTALIDASVVSGTNICEQIYNALQSVLNTHMSPIIDARGVNPIPACKSGETPWLQGGSNFNFSSTILLPAGTITISSAWIMPDGTKLIGEGSGMEVNPSSTGGTILQVPSTFSGTMIQMGFNRTPSGYSSAPCPNSNICRGISIEDLTLDGEGESGVNGILNSRSQELSYVAHVKLYQILGAGLTVSGSAQNSGPYTNITFDTGGIAPSSSTSCAQIEVSGTRGIHGLTCIAGSNGPTAAVYLDSSNNSIEDVIIEGFTDGIRVGSQAAAHSNVLLNIDGDNVPITQTQGPAPINVVHVTAGSVNDLSMMGIRHNSSSGLTIKDDLTTTNLSDPFVAMYALGEAGLGGSGYSRFTTSPNATAWAVGSSNPQPSGCATQNLGSLYSSTVTGTGSLWVCELTNAPGGGLVPTWVLVK
jgi:hypothetical protein